MSVPVLVTKLYIPPARRDVVPRSRLMERLNQGLSCRLILVSAAAGFGKTTLVAEWVAQQSLPVAWLSLDEEDSDPARFYNYLVTALQTVDARIGQAGRAMLQSPPPPPRDVLLSALVNEIAAAEPFVLVLDDYHTIRTLAIHEQLGFLLQHQPPNLHLVVATREDPPLPLARLRAGGQMVEIRQADLAFTAAEVAEFLNLMGQVEISDADLEALQRRTEGWVAGLQLLALSLQGREDAPTLIHAFAGSHRFVLDYLVEEVLDRQPADLQEFLLKTSILERLAGPLCDSVTGRGDSAAVLLALERANLFVVPLDVSREWYRYHHLFADLLRHRLHTVWKELEPDLHQRASQWCADNGFPADAVRHALAASDWDRAARIMLSGLTGSLMARGEVVTVLGWFAAIPEEFVRNNPRLAMEIVWPLILSEQFDAAEKYLELNEQRARDGADDRLLGNVLAAHVHIARAQGDNRRAVELSEQALALLPDDDLPVRCVLTLNVGIAHWLAGRLAEAEERLEDAERTGRMSGNAYAGLGALIFLSRIEEARGYLRQAQASCERILELGGEIPITSMAHYELARLLYGWNDLVVAARHVERGIELSRRGRSAEQEAAGYGLLALVKQAQRESAAVSNALREAARCLEHPGISPIARQYNLEVRILVALAQGDLVAAREAAEQLPKPEDSGSLPGFLAAGLAKGRWLLAEGRRAEVAGHLDMLYGMASQAGFRSVEVQVRALQALAAQPGEELAILAEALAMAGPEGNIRAFVDLSEPMALLLRRATSHGIAVEYVRRLLDAFEGISPPADTSLAHSPKAATAQSGILIEQLSDRELDVLRLLVEGRTNQELALALCISGNTVKTHLSNIYGKLGVSSRKDAVARAATLNLLP